MIKKPKKCCKKVKCDSELQCKATAELCESVKQELNKEDKPLEELLNAQEQNEDNS